MPGQAIIIINPYSRQGRGWKRWLSVKDAVRERIGLPLQEIVIEKGMDLNTALSPKFDATISTLLVSAGGDGSLHYLVNYLLTVKKEALSKITVGAIGLGSSNDFLKPFGEKLSGVPVRINCNSGRILYDVGVASYRDEANTERQKFFIVNASLGVTAEANWRFNHPGTLLRFLKKRFTNGAIIYTAISTILHHQNKPCSIQFDKTQLDTLLSNVNVLKVPYVSGSFFYNQPIARNDGRLGLNVCMNMSRSELLSVLAKLQKGIFLPGSKTFSAFVENVSVKASQPFVFECDGETEKTTSLSLAVLPNALCVLKN